MQICRSNCLFQRVTALWKAKALVSSHILTSGTSNFSTAGAIQGPIPPPKTIEPQGFMHGLKRTLLAPYEDARLKRLAYYFYRDCSDEINYLHFIKELELPDTFFSWFLVTEMHVWLCQSRIMSIPDQSRYLRNNFIEAMWIDCKNKMQQLPGVSHAEKKYALDELYDHFKTVLFSYDEGLLSDDKTLASALWRMFYNYKCKDPRQLEKLVYYIRKQAFYLENLSDLHMLRNGKINWLPVEETLIIPKQW